MSDVALYLEDSLNDEQIIFTQAMQPCKIYYLTTVRGHHAGYFNMFYEVIKSDFKQIEVIEVRLKAREFSAVQAAIDELTDLTAVHLLSSDQLLLMSVEQLTRKKPLKRYYTDVQQGRILQIKAEGISQYSDQLDGIEVAAYVNMVGGDILKQTTAQNDDKKIVALTLFIAENQKRWQRLKRILTRSDVFKHDPEDATRLRANTEHLSNADYKHFKWLLDFLMQTGMVRVKKIRWGVRDIFFNQPDYRSFIFVTGSWLESLTFNTIRLIEGVEDTRSGVTFSWEAGSSTVKNEIDVLASYQSRLICVSCKDTSHYNGDTLNELAVYANKLGGAHTVKLLVSTRLPQSPITLERARDMAIDIVIFDGNPTLLREQIEGVLAKASKQ